MCAMCHVDIELADHFFIQCPVASYIWNYFGQLLRTRCVPSLFSDLWGGIGEKTLESHLFLGPDCAINHLEHLA